MSSAAYQREWRRRHGQGRPPGRPVTAACGTAAAYKRHLRRGEPVDQACREAWNTWQRHYYQTRKGTGS
jgi:hypothetical protein